MDLIVVEGYYSTVGWQGIVRYHYLFFGLQLAATLILLLRNVFDGLICGALFFCFLEDSLYWIVKSGGLPPVYYGVVLAGWFEPPLWFVLTFNFIGLIIICVVEVAKIYVVKT